ncbi:MAG TPA: dethiobiotin synthase [Pedomonas sp.]|nr:dethiobiotin synthase [Pedomonas sp.]
MSRLFITATGTDIGKTYVSALLLRQLRAKGLNALGLKPVLSGFDEATRADSDPARLLEAMGEAATPEAIASISPWRFRAPLSPDMAAKAEGRALPYGEMVAFCEETAARHEGPLLVEGVGGVMVPLDARHTVLDWMADLGFPAVLVAGTYLGAISHTLTALAVLKARGVPVRAVVLSESEGATVPTAETVATLRRFCEAEIRVAPRGGSGNSPDLTDLIAG